MLKNIPNPISFQAAYALKLDPKDNPIKRRQELMALTASKGEKTEITQTKPIEDIDNGFVFLVTDSDKSMVESLQRQTTTGAHSLTDKLKATFIGSLISYIANKGNVIEIKPDTPLKDQITVSEDKHREIKINTIA